LLYVAIFIVLPILWILIIRKEHLRIQWGLTKDEKINFTKTSSGRSYSSSGSSFSSSSSSSSFGGGGRSGGGGSSGSW
jgi:uncharacterized protein